MARLITMLGSKEGGISADTARSLLYVIESVTPRQYLDQNAQSHLRLIHEFYVVDQGPEVLQEGGNTFDHPGADCMHGIFHIPRRIAGCGMEISIPSSPWESESYCSWS
jgi:hypothetical protein